MTTTPNSLPAISKQDTRLHWGGIVGISQALALSDLSQNPAQPLLIVTETIHEAKRLQQEMSFFGQNNQVQIFPDWETLPYDHFSPHQAIISERLALLAKLSQGHSGTIITAISTLMQRLIPKSHLQAHSLVLKVSDKLDLENLKKQLVQAGYHSVSQVLEHGEFAVRGAIIDVFMMGTSLPYRIELFDNEIDSIRQFDPDSQRSFEKISAIELLPAHEYPLNEQGISQFRQSWRERFSGNPLAAPMYQRISDGEAAAGAEYYLALFYSSTSTLLDYVAKNTVVVKTNRAQEHGTQFWQEVNDRYEQLRHDTTRPLLPPNNLYLNPAEIGSCLSEYTQIKMTKERGKHFNFSCSALPEITINHRLQDPLAKVRSFLSETKQRILFCTESTGRREVLLDLLSRIEVKPTNYTCWNEFLNDDTKLGILVSPLEHGVILADYGIAIITEDKLFGEQIKQRQYRKQRQLDPNVMIRNLTELSIGAPVVHIDHGVGRYLGLQTIKTGELESEYLTLEYADKDRIYVPVGAFHLISRYTGADAENAPMQKLGSKQWSKIKDKATKKIRDTAAELLDVYGKRQASQGFSFKLDPPEYQKFSDTFAFEETPDQKNAIDSVLNDMQKTQCMDRLVCGDVGFGKTEVAMRAAFVAAMNNKQVAVLVPTTLLANQHLANFQDRFADWPVQIAGICRLQAPAEQAKTLKNLAAGKVDIIIGTHKLLSETIQFKDLGLLIIDEEQRFGVRQKERMTSLRANIDILTLTATPIPRTLNMAMAGTRDLSIIATPPARRLSIKTFIHERCDSIIREAVLRETLRGGQVYFVHNDVSTMLTQRNALQKIIPEAKIAMAHGQLRERELEQVMSDFYHQRFNVILCSTIIESGIDIPSANTIIINRADKFGLSQLHQLRGRVGRSHHQAYAYLLTPAKKQMTKDATKRLDAIAELGDLGVGFSLATYDLEIRGAGELLGEEQSGHIQGIGFTLYMELLEKAVSALKTGSEPELNKTLDASTDVEINISALLPKDYVGDVHLRLSLYKRLANCKSTEDIQELKSELIDRFGLLPEVTQNLFSIAKLKLDANKFGITKIEVTNQFGYFTFNENPMINLSKMIELIQQQPKQYQLLGSNKLRFQLPNKEEKIAGVLALIKTLTNG